MKRLIFIALIIGAAVAVIITVRGDLPFMAVQGKSMEPGLKAGDLIWIEELSPSEVKVGDVIVYTVDPRIQKLYNYSPVVAHRVTKVIDSEEGASWRTKGDYNSGEDPFTVLPQHLKGKVGRQISYLGIPLLFFQSKQGEIFAIIALSLLALYLYADEFGQGIAKAQRAVFAPVIEENQRNSQMLEQRMESTEQVLGKFTSAIEVYAQHLQNHTAAVQGLMKASQELEKSAAGMKQITQVFGAQDKDGQPRYDTYRQYQSAQPLGSHGSATHGHRLVASYCLCVRHYDHRTPGLLPHREAKKQGSAVEQEG